MYHADTPTQTIRAYEYNVATGTPSRPRVLERLRRGDRPTAPPSTATETTGPRSIAAASVVRLSPEGEVLAEYPVPAMCPTMCAFGGTDLTTVYVTSARQKRDADELARLPHSGGIFAFRVAVPGLPEPAFAG